MSYVIWSFLGSYIADWYLIDWLVGWLIDWLIDWLVIQQLSLWFLDYFQLIKWIMDKLPDLLIDYSRRCECRRMGEGKPRASNLFQCWYIPALIMYLEPI